MSRSKKIKIAETSIERLGRILTERWGIKVVFKGEECKTDGKIIYLPVIPDDASEEFLHAMQGRLDHEAAHVLFTNFDDIDKKLVANPKAFTILNAMEDVRIERAWIKMYPGARLNLSRIHQWVSSKIVDASSGQRPWDRLSDFGKYIQGTLSKFTHDEPDATIESLIPQEVKEKIEKTLDLYETAKGCPNTKAVIPLVKEALKRLNENEDAQQDPAKSTQPDQQDQGQQDQNQQNQGQQGQSQQDQTQQDQGQGQQGQQDQSPQDQGQGAPDDSEEFASPQEEAMLKPTAGGKGKKKRPKQGPQDQEKKNTAQEKKAIEQDQEILDPATYIKQDASKNLDTGTDRYLIYTTEQDVLTKIPNADRVEYGKFLQDSVRIVATMKRKLSRSLLARKASHWEEGKKRGKINGRRLYKVVCNTGRDVFKQQIEGENFDTCILLAVDHSSSMFGDKIILAAKTATILGELFNQIGIPFACYGFSTERGSVASARKTNAPAQERDIYSRWGNLWLAEYKSFNDSWSKAGPKMITMSTQVRHNTYDGESLKRCAQILMRRPEARKILFWLNDGQPCPNGADNEQAHYNYAKTCAKEVEKLVEVIAVGIKTDAVRDFYKYWIVVKDTLDLPKTCLAELDKRLRETKRVGRRTA